MNQPRTVLRYTPRQRANHWAVALLFVCAGATGLALFHPSLYFLSALFGGGTWTRILHPYFGLLMMLGFVFLFFAFVRANRWRREDTQWLRRSPQLIRGHEDAMPPMGKYNAGQKAVFWLFALSLVVLLVTGVLFWQAWFGLVVPIPVQRVAALLHAVAAFVLVLGVIVHVYAAIWVRGSVQAMTRGSVTPGWARQHHPLWWRELRRPPR